MVCNTWWECWTIRVESGIMHIHLSRHHSITSWDIWSMFDTSKLCLHMHACVSCGSLINHGNHPYRTYLYVWCVCSLAYITWGRCNDSSHHGVTLPTSYASWPIGLLQVLGALLWIVLVSLYTGYTPSLSSQSIEEDTECADARKQTACSVNLAMSYRCMSWPRREITSGISVAIVTLDISLNLPEPWSGLSKLLVH